METTVSIKEIDEVKAAKKTSIKKIKPIIVPPGILSKIFGRAINISPGPFCIFSIPVGEEAATAGTIISPAKKAMPVSKISILCTDDSTLTSFFIYTLLSYK